MEHRASVLHDEESSSVFADPSHFDMSPDATELDIDPAEQSATDVELAESTLSHLEEVLDEAGLEGSHFNCSGVEDLDGHMLE